MERKMEKEQHPSYQVIETPITGEYEEKRSRFLADLAPVESMEEAAAFAEAARRRYYDARHHCTAYIIGRKRELTRCSDDGEPSGTAGKPMLEVLLSEKVTNVAAVVTRYFGGTLLGTGGLVRAYTQAVKEALAKAQIAVMRYGAQLTIHTEYGDMGKIQHYLEKKQIGILTSRYTDKVELDICIPVEEAKQLSEELIELTAARARVEESGFGYYKSEIR